MAFDGTHGFAVEACRRNHAGWAGLAGAVRIINDHRATQTLSGSAPEFGAGQPEIFAQEIIHTQIIAHLHRAIGATIDADPETAHDRAPLSMGWVTGSE